MRKAIVVVRSIKLKKNFIHKKSGIKW